MLSHLPMPQLTLSPMPAFAPTLPHLPAMPAPPQQPIPWPQPGPSALPPEDYDDLEPDDDDEDEDEDFDDPLQTPIHHSSGKGKSRLGGPRAPGACDACKQSKVRCVFPDDPRPGAKCRHCERSGHDCHVSGRKPKPRPPSHAELLDRVRQKDDVIVRLLHPRPSTTDDDPAAAASRVYALSRRLPALHIWNKHIPKEHRQRLVDNWITQARLALAAVDPALTPLPISLDDPILPTDILRAGLVTPQEVDLLFRIFFDKINMFFTICDPVLHTPAHVYRTSPFLFTTICAVASRHHGARPDLYPKLLHAAMKAAGAALHVPKAVETCQAYLLLGVYHPPPRTFVEDRTFLFLGLAIRMATDLGLHLPQPQPTPDMSELEARALLNRARVWLNCYCTDRSISTQLGKPSAITFARAPPYDLRLWWASSPYNGPHDIHMCAYASLLIVQSDFFEFVVRPCEGDMQRVDLAETRRYVDQLDNVAAEWEQRLAESSACYPHPATIWRDNLWPFIVYYTKLVACSVGLQAGMRQGLRADNPFGDLCVEAATDVLTHVTGRLASLGYIRYCVEAYFVFMGFAAAFLLKILRPKFAFLMHGRPGRAADIAALVRRLVDLLGSDAIAIDGRHTPRLYARFLRGVMEREGLLGKEEKKCASGGANGDERTVYAAPGQAHASSSTPAAMTAQLAGPTIPTDVHHGHAHLHPHAHANAHPHAHAHAYGHVNARPVATPPTTFLPGPSASYADPGVAAACPSSYASAAESSPYAPAHYAATGGGSNASTHHYAYSSSPAAPVVPVPPQDELLSMAAIADPQFWDHGGMPGWNWLGLVEGGGSGGGPPQGVGGAGTAQGGGGGGGAAPRGGATQGAAAGMEMWEWEGGWGEEGRARAAAARQQLLQQQQQQQHQQPRMFSAS